MKRILVAYASKYGSTREIAEAIGKSLQSRGLQVDIDAVSNVESVETYDAVVLGSAVFAGRWMDEALKFAQTYVNELAAIPTWLFSSGPTGEGDPDDLLEGWTLPENVEALNERIQARDIAVFHGKLDMDELPFFARLIVKGVKAPVGDFRQWDLIEAWAEQIAKQLQPVSYLQ